MENIQKLSDKELYTICKKWGAEVLEARRKFGGLLPEVYRREMAARVKGGSWTTKRGFSDVYEFAAKLAGMSPAMAGWMIISVRIKGLRTSRF